MFNYFTEIFGAEMISRLVADVIGRGLITSSNDLDSSLDFTHMNFLFLILCYKTLIAGFSVMGNKTITFG